jgi:hypothetical protein
LVLSGNPLHPHHHPLYKIIGFTHAVLLWLSQYRWLNYFYLVSLFLYHYGTVCHPFNR